MIYRLIYLFTKNKKIKIITVDTTYNVLYIKDIEKQESFFRTKKTNYLKGI
jgi:hypothetical protein